VLVVAVAALYGAASLPLAFVGLLALASTLSMRREDLSILPPTLLAASAYLFLAGVFAAAGFGLFRERRWARWPFLAIAFLAVLLAMQATPMAWEAYEHFRSPPEGAYKILSGQEFLDLLAKCYAPSVVSAFVCVFSAVFVFWKVR
jgi:hypothetical protein